MAELGDEWIYGDFPTEEKIKEVTIEMLDFSYVEQCRDLDTLKAIVARLSTGEEKGLYPELTAVAKKQLWDILPDDVKRRAAVAKEPSENEKGRATEELLAFQAEFGSSDVERLEKHYRQRSTLVTRPTPPVRGSAGQERGAASIAKQEQLLPRSEEKRSNQAIGCYDYEGWERLDTGAIEKAMEKKDEEEIRVLQTNGHTLLSLDKKQAVRRRKEERLGVEAYSPMERRSLTVGEACKAKECHKAKEYEQALYHYERAIAFDFGGQNSSLLYHSRAATYVALNSLQAAENDMDVSLSFCDTNPDLWIRRAVVRAKRGQHDQAVKDLDEVLLLDPKNETAVALRRKCVDLHRQQEGERLGLKEVSSKKHGIDIEKEDTQHQHDGEGEEHHVKSVSFRNEPGPGEFVQEDNDKYEEDKLLRETHGDLSYTKFIRHVARFSDGTEPGEFVPEDDLKYEEDRRIEKTHPDLAKTKHISSDVQCDCNGDSKAKQPRKGEFLDGAAHSELERGRMAVIEDDDGSSKAEENAKLMNFNKDEETQQWKSIPVNFDEDDSSDSSSLHSN